MSNKRHTIDVNLQLKDAGAITSSAAATVGGSAKILDVGSGLFEADLLLEVSAMDIASNDEIYDIVLQGSPDAAFGTAGNIQDIASISLSAKEVKRTDSDKDDVIGHYVVPVTNEFLNTRYRYLRLYTVVAGTTPSINYTAFLSTT